jgi:hypothetical protein
MNIDAWPVDGNLDAMRRLSWAGAIGLAFRRD